MPAARKRQSNNLLSEAIKRTGVNAPVFHIHDYCFDKQLHFIKDSSKFKVAVCSRRAGKTEACAADLVSTAMETPGVNVLYITLSRVQAKRIIWKKLKTIIRAFKIPAHINETELTITLTDNDSTIYVSGCKDASEIDKFRGDHYKKVYIDEAQAFKSYIYELIDDALEPALRDYDGQLILIGTPNAACAGALFEAAHDIGQLRGFSRHHWTQLDNPWLEKKSGKPVVQLLEEKRKRKGITEDDPSYQREDLGKWIKSLDSIVYKYDPSKNSYSQLPTGVTWEYVLGVDLGWHDADALVVIAFSRSSPVAYVVEEFKKSKMDITALAEVIKDFERRYTFVKKVIDTGGLGKKITEELANRHNLYLEAAEKTRKIEFIELMNDDFRRGRIKAHPSMEICEEWSLLQWDDSRTPPKEDSRFENHLADAGLYAWREARHYMFRPEEEKPAYGTKEYYDLLDREMEAIEEEKFRQAANRDIFEEIIDLNVKEFWEE